MSMQQPQAMVMYRPPTNGLATASLISGLVGFFVCPFIGSILAVILGHVAHGQIKRSGESGAGMATAGLALGYIEIVGWIGFFLFWIVVLGGLTAIGAALGGVAASPSP